MSHQAICRICNTPTTIMQGQLPLCGRCKGTKFRVRCTTCRSTTAAYPTDTNPKCARCKGRHCSKCQKVCIAAKLTLDQVCLDCAKKSPSAVYACDVCKGLFEIEIVDSLPRTKPSRVVCWHCTLSEEGEV